GLSLAGRGPGPIPGAVRFTDSPADSGARLIKTVTWVVVLVEDFDSAKQRLGPALDPSSRRALVQRNAQRAVRAASAGDQRLVVAGSQEVATMADRLGAQVILEPRQEGQNVAAKRGIARA